MPLKVSDPALKLAERTMPLTEEELKTRLEPGVGATPRVQLASDSKPEDVGVGDQVNWARAGISATTPQSRAAESVEKGFMPAAG